MWLLLVLPVPLRASLMTGRMAGLMRYLNPTLLVMAVTDPLTWDNDMELVRGNGCVMDARNNPRTRYLINNARILAGRKSKMAAMNNGISGRGGGKIPLVSGRTMGTEGQLTVYNHWGGRGGATSVYTPIPTLWERETNLLLHIRGSQERMVRLFMIQ